MLIFLELTHVVVKGSPFSRLLFMFFNRLIYIYIQVRRKRWRNLKLTLIWNIIRPRSLLIFISKIIKCECKRGTHFMLNLKNKNEKTPPNAAYMQRLKSCSINIKLQTRSIELCNWIMHLNCNVYKILIAFYLQKLRQIDPMIVNYSSLS